MATWIDASTDVYWQWFNAYIGEYVSEGYLGSGHWAFDGNGIDSLEEPPTSPLKQQYDEYTYAYSGENITVSGIRLYYSFELDAEWGSQPNNFQFETNYARVSTLIPNGLVSGTTVQEWTFDPDIDERIDKIIIPFGFSDNYAITAIITKIELLTNLSPDPLWRDYRNTRERISE